MLLFTTPDLEPYEYPSTDKRYEWREVYGANRTLMEVFRVCGETLQACFFLPKRAKHVQLEIHDKAGPGRVKVYAPRDLTSWTLGTKDKLAWVPYFSMRVTLLALGVKHKRNTFFIKCTYE